MSTRTLLSASLLLLATASVAPMAAASIDNVWACKGTVHDSPCSDGDVLYVNVKQEHAGVCVIGVSGSCDPYDGDLVRADVDVGPVDGDYGVPDPCYTTACF